MVTKGLNKITQNETQDPQLVDNFCKSWATSRQPLDIGHSSYTIFLTHRKFNKFSLVSEISDKSSDKFRNKT